MEIIRFAKDELADFEKALELEWLETNGIGGFASSTVTGCNTRRYHGLLTAAAKPPVGRTLLLSKLEETVVSGGVRYDLGANRYPGAVHPRGFELLREFRLDPFPTFVYQAGGAVLEKRVFLVHGENTVVAEYELLSASNPEAECTLEVQPLIAFRDYHATTHRNGALNPGVVSSAGWCSVAPYGDHDVLYFAHRAQEMERTGDWYLDFEFDRERERGLDFREDLFQPFALGFRLRVGETVAIIASTAPRESSEAPALREAEIARRAALLAATPVPDPFVAALTVASSAYLVKRGAGKTVIAGYHWFSDWGRDTMIALPGLTLSTGRFDDARGILSAFAASVDEGMLPNRFPDAGEAPEYNTVDATLWFFEAIRAYLEASGDEAFVRNEMYPALVDIFRAHRDGTRYGIRADDDGLLACGVPGLQLTWMDAKVGDWVVTPRTGKPVEIQALWYNALRVLEGLAARFGDSVTREQAARIAGRAQASFRPLFWNEAAGCLFDCVNVSGADPAIRPNQLFAISLAHSLLDGADARSVVSVCERELLTPLGLRSLSPGDPAYRGRYEGGVVSRDGAYHQGTVWPWLMGPFIEAYLKVNGASAEARAQARTWLEPLHKHLRHAGLGHISEVAGGDEPHRPGGCIAQAWSVAELLRASLLVIAPQR